MSLPRLESLVIQAVAGAGGFQKQRLTFDAVLTAVGKDDDLTYNQTASAIRALVSEKHLKRTWTDEPDPFLQQPTRSVYWLTLTKKGSRELSKIERTRNEPQPKPATEKPDRGTTAHAR